MKHVVTIAATVALFGAGAAQAGIGRSSQSVGILFKQGNQVEFSLGGFNPDVSGSAAGGKVSSGDMSPGYGTYSLGYKQALSDRLDLAIILDQPIGAKVKYPGTLSATSYPMAGSTARIKSDAVTGLLRYKLPQNLSLYGGVRIERGSGKVHLPSVSSQSPVFSNKKATEDPYTLDSSTETDIGYVIGVAWEKPEIAARVALTYNSKIEHKFTATEWGKAPKDLPLDLKTNTFTSTVPESVNLEFQTGIAPDTLLMGSVRWVHWTQLDITPPAYHKFTAGESLFHPDHNGTTWKIGLGHRFSDQWSGAAFLGYERHQGTPKGQLSPTDGFKSATLAASYQASDKIKITAGVSYVDIGDAVTERISGRFSDNSGWGGFLGVGIQF